MTERKTWVIPKNKWHARLYRAWRSVASFKADGNYRENLCHYWRVVIFWAPITLFVRWFVLGQTPKDPRNTQDKPPPLAWLALIIIGATLVALPYFTMTWWGATLVVVGIPAIAVLLGLISEFGPEFAQSTYDFLRNRDRAPKEQQPNLLVEVLRAKKHKICPLIEIENGDPNE